MPDQSSLETIECPCCHAAEFSLWAEERGFQAVRCASCRLVYVNPRPALASIDEAVRLGEHRIEGKLIDVRARRVPKKVAMYKRLIARMFSDRLQSSAPLIWVDFGAGYGEIIEAVAAVAPPGSKAIGVEPMAHKAAVARQLGLEIVEGYPQANQFEADVISMVNIFSHIPDFHEMLRIAASNLKASGEIFIETGNLADLDERSEFFGILDLPDHLVFSGEPQIARYLAEIGFEIVGVERARSDGVVAFAKTVAKKMLGHPVYLRPPYRSRYRQLMIRGRRKVAN